MEHDEHQAQVRTINLTQTVYSIAEIKNICSWAHKNNILVLMDGVRLANAVVTLGGNLRATTVDLGVDIISFGATNQECLCTVRYSCIKNAFSTFTSSQKTYTQKYWWFCTCHCAKVSLLIKNFSARSFP